MINLFFLFYLLRCILFILQNAAHQLSLYMGLEQIANVVLDSSEYLGY